MRAFRKEGVLVVSFFWSMYNCWLILGCHLFYFILFDYIPYHTIYHWFSNLSYKHPCPAHFACLPYQTHLIQLISSLVDTARPELGVSDKGDMCRAWVLVRQVWKPLPWLIALDNCILYTNIMLCHRPDFYVYGVLFFGITFITVLGLGIFLMLQMVQVTIILSSSNLWCSLWIIQLTFQKCWPVIVAFHFTCLCLHWS